MSRPFKHRVWTLPSGNWSAWASLENQVLLLDAAAAVVVGVRSPELAQRSRRTSLPMFLFVFLARVLRFVVVVVVLATSEVHSGIYIHSRICLLSPGLPKFGEP